MDINNFDQKLVNKIKEEHITPRPRWHFLLKDYVVKLTGILALLVGAAAVSVMIYLLKYNDWEIREETHKNIWEFFLLTLPYFWLILLAFFIFLLYYNLQHTKRGYRYPVWFIASAAFLASIILGSIFYLAGLGEKIDLVLGEKAPLYEKVINRHFDFWFNPSEGRLIGVVLLKSNEQSFVLLDPSGTEWQVTAKEGDFPVELLRVQQPVNLTGEITSDNKFTAENIHPVKPGRGFWSRPRPGHPRACQSGSCPMRPNLPGGNLKSPSGGNLMPTPQY